jgi:hypothetical protein
LQNALFFNRLAKLIQFILGILKARLESVGSNKRNIAVEKIPGVPIGFFNFGNECTQASSQSHFFASDGSTRRFGGFSLRHVSPQQFVISTINQ